MFKTELHAHNAPQSRCAHADVRTLVDRFTAAGYSTVMLSNHISRYNFKLRPEMTWRENVEFILQGYHDLKEAAGDRLHILLGAEMRSMENSNDYLVFGLTEEKLRSLSCVYEMPLRQLTDTLHDMDCLIYQAHPFRFGITITDPAREGIDGMEVYNSHKNHDSHNDIAQLWADKMGLPQISGSDFHDPEGYIGGGIRTEYVIDSMDVLMRTLRENTYTLIKE
ncbi:MAG: hypothetical protein CW338_09735 [Clostridiales bacterium]|nr:hypothetical protein [Clostridiales bacterium]